MVYNIIQNWCLNVALLLFQLYVILLSQVIPCFGYPNIPFQHFYISVSMKKGSIAFRSTNKTQLL